MGYQESLIRVDSLAEVAGIEKAIEESEELKTTEYLCCCCAARAKRDIFRGSWLGRPLSDVGEDEKPVYKAGTIFALVAGARLYQPFFWIDCIAGIHDLDCSVLFETIPLEKAREEAVIHPEFARKAECWMRRSLNHSYHCFTRGKDQIVLPKEFWVDGGDECPGYSSLM